MTCLSCGAWAPSDQGTGYDADAICPRCAEEGWEVTRDGQLLGPDDQRVEVSAVSRVTIARVPSRMVRAHLRRRPARGASIG